MANLYTIREVSKMLKLAEGTIRNKISTGEIRAVKILGSTRITSEEIERLITPIEIKSDKEG